MITVAERLVHGPLTALMLLEISRRHIARFAWSPPSFQHLKAFEYRAINPMVVNRSVCVGLGPGETPETLRVWAKDREGGVIGMTGKITFARSL